MLENTDEQLQMIEDCEKRQDKMTEWEQVFIDSISHQSVEHPLSEKQAEQLDKIWDRVTG